MKQKIIKFLLKKLDQNYIEKYIVNSDKLTINLKGLIPKDNTWYNLAFTFSFWMKNGSKKESKFEDMAIFKNGLKQKDIKKLFKITQK
ncbi:MAG: hypothetical protein PHO75_02340 [Candidatus Shapirobacteria bacterium]|nr:hypothetical protein [Candidatus Shapirobacteria bacterium]